MVGTSADSVDDTLVLLAIVVVVGAAALRFVALGAGQWSDQSASHTLVIEEIAVEGGVMLFLGDSVEVTFAYGARHPE